MRTTRSHAPIIAAILLLLPVLYVGSYFALVVPEGRVVPYEVKFVMGSLLRRVHYRVGHVHAGRIFWPLEQMDRRLRPGAWERDSRINL